MTTTRVGIWNPASGSAPDQAELEAALGRETDLVETTEDDPGTGQASKAVDRGVDIVVACGGDGTVRACLEALAGTPTALGIVPLGTGNLMASNLGLDDGLAAASAIGVGEQRSIDLGTINGEHFAVMAGTGFDAFMIRDAKDTTKSRFGSIAYVISGAKHLRTAFTSTTVAIDGRPWFHGRSSMVLVGNFGTITGGIQVFPDARPDDGLLDIAVVAATTRRDWIRLAWHLVRKGPAPASLIQRAQGRTVTVQHRTPRDYELDGEARPPVLRLDIEVQPDALILHQETGAR